MLDILITTSRNEGTIDDEGIREEVDTFVFEVNYSSQIKIIEKCFPSMSSALLSSLRN